MNTIANGCAPWRSDQPPKVMIAISPALPSSRRAVAALVALDSAFSRFGCRIATYVAPPMCGNVPGEWTPCDNYLLMAESNVQLARRGFEAALRGDFDAIASMLDPDVKWHGGDPTAPGGCQNRDQALRFMRQSEAIQSRGFELVDLVDADDKVVVII